MNSIQSADGGGGSLRIINVGTLFTGRWDEPVREGTDVIICRDGLIESIGSNSEDDLLTLDVAGATVVPGLIDPHVHPVFGDFTPRIATMGWIEAHVNGGVTTLISAGEPHVPGRPKDPAGVKALAILAHKSFQTVHPLGATVHAGALLLEHGLIESDFADLAGEGCWLVGEIGISSAYEVDEVLPMVRAAKKYGFHVPVHVGGASVPGSSVIGADTVVALQPDVAVHCNGGPTAPSNVDIARIIDETAAGIEVVQAGNTRALIDVVRMLRERDAVDRLQIASDTPSGTGVIPSAILRTMAYCVALGGIEPAQAVCAATGQTARRFGLECGIIEPGRPADITVLSAPRGSTAPTAAEALRVGDMPAVTAVITGGVIRLTRSSVTPPAMTPAIVRSP